jgi:DNA-binding MarR family transcriptional regulator/GNAT superfamily N-acetyltransferase
LLGQLDDVPEQHQALDAVERCEQRVERLAAAQDVVAQAAAEVEIGYDERGHAGATMPQTARDGLRCENSLTKVRDMDDVPIRQVRSFNRSVTQRIGALQDGYLARDRPLGASRVLWEIGGDGTDLRALRGRLDLDSGYLSRLVQSLERDGLVVLEQGSPDKRIRTARLTGAGRAERELLDRHSDELAASLLAPLSDAQRERLVEAMGVVERLLTAGLVEVGIESPVTAAARLCLQSYFSELDARFDTGFDPGRSISADAGELTEPAGLLLVAWLRGEPVGCGALKLHGGAPAEIKRMWVAPTARGLGVGRRILGELEQNARRRGVGLVRLETNGSLHEATGLYRSAGYAEVEAFNDEPYAHHWFEKRIDPSSAHSQATPSPSPSRRRLTS